jgi:hypothetical protein
MQGISHGGPEPSVMASGLDPVEIAFRYTQPCYTFEIVSLGNSFGHLDRRS